MLRFPEVDVGDGWLIFKLPPAEVAVHPTPGVGKHTFYLMYDDIEQTVAELTAEASPALTRFAMKAGDG